MMWTVIVGYHSQTGAMSHGSFIMNTPTHDRAPAWKLAQQQIGGEGFVVALIKGRHEVTLKEDLT